MILTHVFSNRSDFVKISSHEQVFHHAAVEEGSGGATSPRSFPSKQISNPNVDVAINKVQEEINKRKLRYFEREESVHNQSNASGSIEKNISESDPEMASKSIKYDKNSCSFSQKLRNTVKKSQES